MEEQNANQEKAVSSFKLMKMSKGYNWEIKVYNDDLEVAKARVVELDKFCRAEFGDNSRKEINEHHAEEFAAGVL